WGMGWHIWAYDLDRGTAARLISEGMVGFVAWTPDGRRLVFDWYRTGQSNIYWQPVDQSSPMERLTQSNYTQWPGSWSPDGEILAFVEDHSETGWDIELLNVRDRRVKPFLNSQFRESGPVISSDGRWMAYSSDESGRFEVYVQPFPGGGAKQLISS